MKKKHGKIQNKVRKQPKFEWSLPVLRIIPDNEAKILSENDQKVRLIRVFTGK